MGLHSDPVAVIAMLPEHAPTSPSPSSFSRKRKRPTTTTSTTEPLTPPLSANDAPALQLLDQAVDVLTTEATALSHISRLYQTDPIARDGLFQAVGHIVRANEAGGKLILCGIGKSGLVAMKTVATMKSLGIRCSFLHAAEAIHGDLGDVHTNDVLLFITFSGKTPELLHLLPHIPPETTIMALTSHTKLDSCPLLVDRENAVLLPAPIHEPEEVSFGVCAPTTSTTVAMAIGDMLALTTAGQLHREKAKHVFHRNHPGGAIGKKVKLLQVESAESLE